LLSAARLATSAPLPDIRCRWAPNKASGANGPSVFDTQAIPLQRQVFPRNADLSHCQDLLFY
jgi:hypothetical protein